MHQVTKKFVLLLFGIILTGLFCEYGIYYLVVAQCTWPSLETVHHSDSLKAFILADTHLLGPRRGHWLDKLRREWQMHQAFQTVIMLHRPDVVFVLGDLFDEGEWTNNKEFEDYVNRFYSLFAVPNDVKMHVVAGNHDIGFHNYIRRGSVPRFYKSLNSSSVQLLTYKDNHFVLINSMAMEGDYCNLCRQARNKIDELSGILQCSQNETKCLKDTRKIDYSPPILLQHFPLYRKSDEVCTEPDAPPLPERNKKFRLKIDALSKEATDYLVSSIKPRAVFGGHTHHGCLVHHTYKKEHIEFLEYSVPSFSWRNRPDPKYMLVTITPHDYAVNKCGLPKETTIAITAVLMLTMVFLYTFRWKHSQGHYYENKYKAI
ncbi:hypothetical protein K1T71_001861 [Dendrolimus kikuchii]|uniref:Uncharacterized protein n=1 Tax=Dendrolimus kikuchii TaxID=765133 RepID=A0ACC1DF18_9NEOP|nr:hypothetical protein K1T71_001861 [Dendrolimus kikuchii]